MDVGTLRFAVLTAYPSEDWHSERLLLALGARGEAVAVDPADLSAQLGERGLAIGVGDQPASAFDAFVLARGLSPRGDADVQFALYRALEESGYPVLNRLEPLLEAQDKFRTSLLLQRAGVPTPPVVLAQSAERAVALLRRIGDSVLKPIAGSLGEGIERIGADPRGEQRLLERLGEAGAVYLQRWVPNPGRDVRVFVVGGEAVGAVERLAPPGEFRTNVAQGGVARPVRAGAALIGVAEAAARVLGLDYCGVDVIEGPGGPQVIEVNGNPAFDMIFDATGRDMAVDIARHVERAAREARQARGVGAPRPGQAGYADTL